MIKNYSFLKKIYCPNQEIPQEFINHQEKFKDVLNELTHSQINHANHFKYIFKTSISNTLSQEAMPHNIVDVTKEAGLPSKIVNEFIESINSNTKHEYYKTI